MSAALPLKIQKQVEINSLMKNTLVALALSSIFIISGCASSEKHASVPSQSNLAAEAADVKMKKDRMNSLVSIAKKEDYQVIREGDGIRVIMTSQDSFHPKRNLLLPSGLNSLGKLAKGMSEDDSLHVTIVAHGSDNESLNKNKERSMAIAAVLRLAGIGRHQLASIATLTDAENKSVNQFELVLHNTVDSDQRYAKYKLK